MKKRSHRLFAWIIDKVVQRPGSIVIIAVVLTILSVWTIASCFDIRSDIKDLMPQDTRSVTDVYKIADRMGSVQTLNVYLKVPSLQPLSPERKLEADYLDCMAELGEGEHLLREEAPVGENWCDNVLVLYAREFVKRVRGVESVGNIGFHKDKTFFENNLLLYASESELEQAYEEIDKALTEARRQSGEYKACLLTESDPEVCEPLKPGISKTTSGIEVQDSADGGSIDKFKQTLLDRYAKTELANTKEFPVYRIANGGWMVALEIRFRDSTTSLKAVREEVKKMDALIADIDLNKYDTGLVVDYGGGLNDMKSEYNAIVVDIGKSISITVLSILLLIALFFRSVRSSFRIFIPLLMSTLWSLAITFLTIGYLNLITAFIFAILVGLGIDFGIHLYARYNVERRQGAETKEAIRASVIETGSPLFFGALTTAAAFYTLMFGSFPGFSQFGFVSGTGVLLAFCTMTVVMPAWVLVFEKIKPSKIAEVKKRTPFTPEQNRHYSHIILAVALVLIACVGYSVSKIPEIQFEENFYNLKLRAAPQPNQKTKVEDRKYVQNTRASSPVVVVLQNFEQVSELELLLRRNFEYKNFQQYRRFEMKYPHFSRYLGDMFYESLPYLGQNRSLPMLNALSRILPEYEGNSNSILPLYVTYGKEKSRNLRLYRSLALRMPNTASVLAGLTPEIFEANTSANALPVLVTMQRVMPEWLWSSLPTRRSTQQLNSISDFASIFSYLPGTDNQQAARLELIQKIEDRTSDRQIRFLPENEKNRIKEFRKYLVHNPVHVDDLPEWVKLQFKESGKHPLPPRPESGVDYSFGNIVLLYQTTSTYNGAQAHILTDETRSIRVDGEPIVAATGAFVYADMLTLVKTDGLEIALIALIVILLIAIIQQRNLISAIIVTVPVLSGLAFTLFIMIVFDLKLGLFNIVMLPVIMGIGIDGAIYLYQRYQMLGRGSVVEAMRMVLPPVFMSSFTTLVGFGGMITSMHMGLNTMGELAIIGISACFFMTFLIQPGLIVLAELLNLKSALPKAEYKCETAE